MIVSAPAIGTLNFDTDFGGSTETSGDESPTENEPGGSTETSGDESPTENEPGGSTETSGDESPTENEPGGSTETSGDEPPTENEPSRPTDTDGDGLTNEIESTGNVGGYPLPEADQDHKDLYIRVYVGNGIGPLTDQEKADLREIWAGMPVSNPDGAEGIDLHITQVQLSQSITADLSDESLRDQEEQIYKQRVPKPAQCSVYAVTLVDVTGDPVISGRGASPGYVSIVDGQATQRYNTEYTVRTTIATHELLHNVVGTFEDGSYHTSEGWLTGAPGEHGTQFYMSDKTASHLSENGFAESEYFEDEVCG